MTTTATNTAMLSAIAANPDDDLTRLAYADWLDEHGDQADHDRAELIRVQCEDARDPELPQDHTDYHDWLHCHVVRLRRECKLIDAHPEWTQWPCPVCRESAERMRHGIIHVGGSCLCRGTGLIACKRITWDRGWPGWVHVERVSELVTEIYDGYVTTQTRPTPLLTALAQTPPWGVPLRGVIVEELKPADRRLVNSMWYWFEHGRNALGNWSENSHISRAVFDLLPGATADTIGLPYPTKQAAIRAKAAAFLEFGRRFGSNRSS